MLSTTVEHQTAYYTLSLFFWHEMLFKHLVLRFSSYLQIFMVIYIFPFLKLFLSVRAFATTNVKPYRWTNAPTFGSFVDKTFSDFPFTISVEVIKSPNLLQVKVLSSALKVILSFLLELFDIHDFESDNSEEKNYNFPN